INRLRPQLAKVEGANLFLQPSQDITVGGRISRGQFQYTLQDANLEELNTWAPRMLAKLKTLPELADVSTDQQSNAPQLTIAINRDAAARFGIQPQVIDDTLNDAFGQRQVGQYFTQTNAYFLVLEALPALQENPAVLDQLYVKAPGTGKAVPLSTLVNVDTSHTGPLSVSHQAQFPAVTLSFNLPPGVALGQAVDAIAQAEREIGKPQSLIGSFQGTAQAFQSSPASEPLLILAALIVVYVILGVLYESYIHPLTILSTLPSAGVGALIALWAGGFDLSVIGIIGIILLIGIVKKNGIMLVDFAIAREREGLSPEVAIREACLLRFGPIMMTTMATLLGGLPLMLGTGSGSEHERYSFPCLIDTTTDTEELIGWSPVSKRDVEMPPWWFGGNSPIDQDEALWHPSKEAVALRVATSRRATNVWIWEHKYGLHKLQRSELIKLLQPKGKIDEPNPLTAEIKEWNGDDVFVSVGWGFEPVIGKAVVAWNLSQHKWRAISKEYHRKFEE